MPPYNSLNLGAHCGNNPNHVKKNRKQLFAASNLPSKPIWLKQVHGKDVLKLTGKPYASKQANASYSNTPGTVCAVITANCLPVLFCNQAKTKVAAAHAGWRKLCAGVLKKTASCFANNPKNILAWLGPAIGPRAFKVGAKVRKAFMAANAKASTAFIQHNNKYLANIYLLARQRLASVGVKQIFGGNRCTYTKNKTFFSYRRNKTTKRMASFIWLI